MLPKCWSRSPITSMLQKPKVSPQSPFLGSTSGACDAVDHSFLLETGSLVSGQSSRLVPPSHLPGCSPGPPAFHTLECPTPLCFSFFISTSSAPFNQVTWLYQVSLQVLLMSWFLGLYRQPRLPAKLCGHISCPAVSLTYWLDVSRDFKPNMPNTQPVPLGDPPISTHGETTLLVSQAPTLDC